MLLAVITNIPFNLGLEGLAGWGFFPFYRFPHSAKKLMTDNIKQPPHYTQYKIEPIDFIIANDLDFLYWKHN